ncbi:hypothetical protein DMENIID0001_104050 [Sergentomyia squamirostris]
MKIVVGLTVVFSTISAISANCVFDLRRDTPREKTPIYMKLNNRDEYTYFVPNGQRTNFATNEVLYAYCPEFGNQNQVTAITCKANGDFPVKSHQCRQEIQGQRRVIPTPRHEGCMQGVGGMQHLGFFLPEGKFHPVVQVCYDDDLSRTLFTFHTINGRAIQHAQRNLDRPVFSDAGISTVGLPAGTRVGTIYTGPFQRTIFNTLYGNNQRYVTNAEFLTRGHMAPVADFVFHPEQISTFFLLNAGPENKSVNEGNWETVERLSRQMAAEKSVHMGVVTGELGHLHFQNLVTRRDVRATLSGRNRFVVPNYFWRVLLDADSSSAIVFVTLNNPYATVRPDPCTNVCRDANIIEPDFTNFGLGYTVCCRYADFIRRHKINLPDRFQPSHYPNLLMKD